MSSPVVTVEHLGKKYRIRHQAERQRYVALRDMLAQKLAAPWRWQRQVARPQDDKTTRTQEFVSDEPGVT